MRTKYPILLVVAMATAMMMLSMSGFTANMQAGQRDSATAKKNLQATSQNSSVSTGQTGAADTTGIFSYIVTAAAQIFSFIKMVTLLPVTLQRLGFPAFFAYPVGLVTQLVASIGLIQFIGARVYR